MVIYNRLLLLLFFNCIMPKAKPATDNTSTNKPTCEGRWRGYPFYYTLLTLAEIDCAAVQQEQSHTAKTVESLLRRNHGDDRVSRFRRLALKWAVE